ncbi:hypothetical protein KDL01_06470 [Actinospica durhamensis]|uniref:DUF2530 domain-containing protein n=1 Tax=Actinospica durhamensis TaxID=1508375 RepID=A0A941EL59_9ACTN|nr:hypothetical protein [Actinospica durhamensis]MBR7832898.1 hypothetical protein [Actinospica durhamensis]
MTRVRGVDWRLRADRAAFTAGMATIVVGLWYACVRSVYTPDPDAGFGVGALIAAGGLGCAVAASVDRRRHRPAGQDEGERRRWDAEGRVHAAA